MSLRAGALGGLLLVAAWTSAAFAHHTYAMFDRTHRVTAVGDVKELEFENPHSWLRVLIRDAQGQTAVWSFEMGPPGVLRRQGWTPRSVQVGDRVTVQYYPMRDGSAAGQLISVTFPNGKMLAGGPTGSFATGGEE